MVSAVEASHHEQLCSALQQVMHDHRVTLQHLLEKWAVQDHQRMVSVLGQFAYGTTIDGVKPNPDECLKCRPVFFANASEPLSKDNMDTVLPSPPADNDHIAPTDSHREYDVSSWTQGLSADDEMRRPSSANEAFLDSATSEKRDSITARHMARQIQDRAHYAGGQWGGVLGFEEEMAKQRGGIRGFLWKVVRSSLFETLTAIVILLNTLCLAVRFDWVARNARDETNLLFDFQDYFFILYFTLELILRGIAYRSKFFCGPDASWNVFELVLLVVLLTQRILDFVAPGLLEGINLSFLRMWRLWQLLRLGHIGKMVAQRSVRAEMAIKLVVAGAMSIVPLLLLVLLLHFICAMCILCLVVDFLKSSGYNEQSETWDEVAEKWGSLGDSMLSLYVASTGGVDWFQHTWALRSMHNGAYVIFLVYVALFQLFATNIATCFFIHLMMVYMENPELAKVQAMVRNRKQITKVLEDLLGVKELSYHEFYHNLVVDTKLQDYFLSVLGVPIMDADHLFYSLSASGTEIVQVEVFILGCIQLKGPVTKMDILELRNNVDVALEEHAENDVGISTQTIEVSSSAVSTSQKELLDIQVVGPQILVQHIRSISLKLLQGSQQREFVSAAQDVLKAVIRAQGGCGFVLTNGKGFASMRQRGIEMQVVDRNEKFTDGYMTQRLKRVMSNDENFASSVIEFSSHGDSDQWPPGHPAQGLPKDGYIVMTTSGKTLKAACRLTGLPTPPYTWEGVGTRHLAALAVCWALRLHPSLIIVRGESGKIHCLYAIRNKLNALRLAVPVNTSPEHIFDEEVHDSPNTSGVMYQAMGAAVQKMAMGLSL